MGIGASAVRFPVATTLPTALEIIVESAHKQLLTRFAYSAVCYGLIELQPLELNSRYCVAHISTQLMIGFGRVFAQELSYAGDTCREYSLAMSLLPIITPYVPYTLFSGM